MADGFARPDGPIDCTRWPEQLSSFVVDPGATSRIHGYAVSGDLAIHYGFVDVLLLSLLGELASDEAVAAANAALVVLAPVGPGEAPGRSALLATLSAGHSRAGVQVGWVALCERAATLLQDRADLLEWLKAGAAGDPPVALPQQQGPSPLVASWMGRVTSLRNCMSDHEAALCLLHHAGICDDASLTVCIALAGIGSVVGEATRGARLGFKGQPGDLPTTRLESDGND